MKIDKEIRIFESEVEIRETEGEDKKIRGHAAVFNKLSVDLGGFREKIDPGAFAKTVKKNGVLALWNHDSNIVLGRSPKTLSLSEDDKGLAIEIDPPNSPNGQNAVEAIRRGDVRKMSFAFRTITDQWDRDGEKMPIRTLKEVELLDVSPVAYPAYPQTDVALRSRASCSS